LAPLRVSVFTSDTLFLIGGGTSLHSAGSGSDG
jgi:hypothetical protein